MELRKAKRVVFERGFAANMMAIDGTWRRPCTMEDVSETGARLTVDGSIEGLQLKEFFLRFENTILLDHLCFRFGFFDYGLSPVACDFFFKLIRSVHQSPCDDGPNCEADDGSDDEYYFCLFH